MMVKRFDELTEPPVVGEYYLVACVHGTWDGYKNKWWPIWGAKHEDAKWLNFSQPHWHLNRFFVAGRFLKGSVTKPFHGGTIPENTPLPEPIFRKMKCRRDTFPAFPGFMVRSGIYRHYAGTECKRGAGWICPHKGFDLGSITPDADGIISCPLHGVRIHAETGVVMPATPAIDAAQPGRE